MQISILILFISFIFVAVKSQEAKEEMTCKQVISALTKKQLSGITKCTKSMKFKNGKDKAAKMNCILRCVMQNEGLLNEELKMDQETFDKFMEKQFTPKMREIMGPLLQKCQDTAGPGLNPPDEFCQSYDPLIKCFLTAVTQACPK